MASPTVEPTVISLRVSPGVVGSAIVKLAQAPSTALMTVSVAHGDSLIQVKAVIAFQMKQRPLTEEEIDELPFFPPSIRRNAHKLRITALVETGRSDGSTPIAVFADTSVEIHLECSPPVQHPPGLTAATLIIEGTTWERIEVPVFLLVGEATIVPTVEPVNIRLGIAPGQTVSADLVVTASNVTGATVVGYVLNGQSLIRVKQFIALRPVKKQFTEEEIAEMPLFPPSLRASARKNGYIAFEESGRSDGNTPLEIAPKTKLRVSLEFTAPLEKPPDSVSATFVLEGTIWTRVEVPLVMVIQEIITTLTPRALTIRQGEIGELQLQVTSLAGPATDVTFALAENPGGGPWKFVPPMVHLPFKSTSSQSAQVILEPQVPLGNTSVALTVTAFDGIVIDNRPILLKVLPGLITLSLAQSALTILQGDEATCDITIANKGGAGIVTLTPGPLPMGVMLDPFGGSISPGSITVTKLRFRADPLAKPVDSFNVTMFWAAGDGVNKGLLSLSLAVLLRPESKIFSQPVVTPSGTALGGTVTMILNNDGNYAFQGHMHDSGFPSYKFRVRAAVRSASGKVVVLGQKSGNVQGSEAVLLFDDPQRDLDWTDPGGDKVVKQLIIDNWPDIRSGTMTVSKSYELAGVLGTLGDLLQDVLGFLITDVLFGPEFALVIAVGSELSSVTGASFVGPGGLVGVSVAGGMVWLLGPGMIGAALVTGVVAGAVTDALIKHRPLSRSEHEFASKVFGDTLPPAERIILTNLSNGGHQFTWPNVDGTILVNLGDAFDNPLIYPNDGHTDLNYPMPGQVLIHELTHAWQIHNTTFLPGFICEGAVTGGKNYNYGPPYLQAGMPLPAFPSGLEQQAAIVDQWFGGTRPESSGKGMDETDPYFGYIQNNIRLGVS